MSSSFQMWSATPAAIAAQGDLGCQDVGSVKLTHCHRVHQEGVRPGNALLASDLLVRCPLHVVLLDDAHPLDQQRVGALLGLHDDQAIVEDSE
jgi:hypothetical protein